MNNLLDRFLRYVKVDTQSNPESDSFPSTDKQFNLAKMLVEELEGIGLDDVELDDRCYIMATIPSNVDREVPTVGFIAHVDTSPDMPGINVNPQIIENYDGTVIQLNDQVKLSPVEFPHLLKYKGNTLITTDGTTLLGADDKAGVAEIMTAAEHLMQHPEIKHGKIRIAFTPDEEIGKGADHFDVKKFGADFAFTIDGGEIGELEFENFNAALAKININGKNVHPGTARDVMINSMLVAMELNEMLPPNQRPEHTEKYEGFYHLVSFKGSVEHSEMQYIVRDHDKDKFEDKKSLFQSAVDFMNVKYGKGVVELNMKDQYYNMREKIEPVMHIIDTAKEAYEAVGVEPIVKAIRGGTDGARLSYMGLPTPNIFAGGHNFHGKYEYVPLESMEKSVEVILKIAERLAQK
jgi:tripeptide aminopeptidase